MNRRFVVRPLIRSALAALALLLAVPPLVGPVAAAPIQTGPGPIVVADQLGVSLQLGPVPLTAQGEGWSIGVPLGLTIEDASLDSADDQLYLRTGANGEAWLVVEARIPGPVSGLLRLAPVDGSLADGSLVGGAPIAGAPIAGQAADGERAISTPHHIAVAAEVVPIQAGETPTLLIVAARGGVPLQRMLRLPDAVQSMEYEGATRHMAPPDVQGWQLLELTPPTGSTELQGKLALADGAEVDLQVSLQESITALATTPLPTGWVYERIMTLDERLAGTELRSRVAVVGVRAGERILRRYDLGPDPNLNQLRFFPVGAKALPSIDPQSPHSLLRLRIADGSLEQPGRQPLLVRLTQERALLIDPIKGAVDVRGVRGLRFTGAATTSKLRKNRLFAVRRDTSNGARYLRRWWARLDNGQPRLRGRLFPTPLQVRMDVGELRSFDLRAWRRDTFWPAKPIRESLLLLAGTSGANKAPAPISIFELRLRRNDPGELAGVRRRYTSNLARPEGTELPGLRWINTPTVGVKGYPRRATITVPGLRAREVVEISGVGQRFMGVAFVRAVSHQIQSDGYPLDPMVFLHSDFDGESSSVRRRILGTESLVTRAQGSIAGRRILQLRTSVRGRHSYALVDDGVGGVRAPYALRVLTNGLRRATNLPPRVDAGPDRMATASSETGARVRLRARIADANGDPLAVRWSAPGIRFTNPNARVTRARFPEGTTQVRVRAREFGAKAASYEASDVLDVTVVAGTASDRVPTLSTALRGIYPNPANPRLSIAFTVEARDHIQIRVYDLAGRLVRELLSEERAAGAYDVTWDGTDGQGRAVASGVYPVRLTSSRGVDTGRAVIVR